MVNSVTCKIIIRRDQVNKHGEMSICAQCFVNKQRVVIKLASVEEKYFDEGKELVKAAHPSSIHLNKIISDARSRVWAVLSESNIRNIQLNSVNFRAMFTMTQSDSDFISFFESEMKKRVGEIAPNSYRLHKKTLNKLKQFKRSIPFSMLTPDLLSDFERELIQKHKNGLNTIYSEMKNVRAYTYIAIRRGFEFHNPFLHYKLKRGGSRLTYLTVEELKKVLADYDECNYSPSLRCSYLFFLVSCFTSLRISDVRRINKYWIKDNKLVYLPKKTQRFNRTIEIPLSVTALRIINDFIDFSANEHLKSDQRINDDLKLIAAYAGIKKEISSHVGRHTFATTFLELGGRIEVLQQLLGHKSINETMVYGHVTDKRKNEQMKNFDNEFK